MKNISIVPSLILGNIATVLFLVVPALADPPPAPPMNLRIGVSDPVTYDITLIALPGGGYSKASGLNDNGDVIAEGVSSSRQLQGFVYKNGQFVELGSLTSIVRLSTGVDINDAGHTTGGSMSESFNNMAFFHNGSTMTALGSLPGSPYSYSYGMNNLDQIVGYSATTLGINGFDVHAFVWRNGTMVDLGTLGGEQSTAWAINDLGHVVGEADIVGDVGHPTLWKNGVTTDLMSSSGTNFAGIAYDINNKGQIVGFCSRVTGSEMGPRYAMFWDSDLTRQFLKSLGGHHSDAWAINENGEIVGEAKTAAGDLHAVLWKSKSAPPIDLNDKIPPGSNWVLESTYGINERGQIVGVGYLTGDTTRKGFLLTPRP